MNDITALMATMKAAAEKATPGEWWSDVVETDGEYGDGEDRHSGYHSYAVYVGSESLLDMTNSTAACIHEEWDHDYHMAWDETAKRNAEFIAVASPDNVKALVEVLEKAQRAANLNNQWKPDVCPITGRGFFMWIEHPQMGMVPTYGGPFDSYTIPTRDSDGEFSCERYDHDLGNWVDGECVGAYLIDDDEQCRVYELEQNVSELREQLRTVELSNSVLESRSVSAPQSDYFASLVAMARVSADKAMRRFPQPNYVLLKVAEEAGEVVQAGVHYAEKRMEWQQVEGEIVQLLAMLIRLVTEGDQINGITPPAAGIQVIEGEGQ